GRDAGPESMVELVAPNHPAQVEIPALAGRAPRRIRKKEMRRRFLWDASAAEDRTKVESLDALDDPREQPGHIPLLLPKRILEKAPQRSCLRARLRDHEKEQGRVLRAVKPMSKAGERVPGERLPIRYAIEGPRRSRSQSFQDPADVVLDRLDSPIGESGGDPADDFAILGRLIARQKNDRIRGDGLWTVGPVKMLEPVCQ